MVATVKDLNAAVLTLNKNLAGTASVLKRITGMSKDVRKVSDSIRSINTLGRSEKIFDDSANFADSTAGSTSGVKRSQSSSAAMKEKSSETTMPWFYTKRGAGFVAGGTAGLGIAGAAYAALPDLGSVVSRAGGFYGAATLGGKNQEQLRKAVFSGLAGGITGIGDDAAVAAMLTQGMYYSPKSAAFNMRVREVGGAARFLNISNPAAAQAIGAVGTGPMAANFMSYGIFASNPRTGKDLPFDQIVRQIYNRATAGRGNVTRETILTNLRSGALGADIRKLFPDATQQELASNLMVRMAEGKSTDLATLTAEGNPLAAAMRINTSQTSLMERATDPMLKGFDKAASLIEDTNKKLEKYMPDMVFQLKGILDAIKGSNLGAPAGILAGTAKMVGQGLVTAAAVRAFMGKNIGKGASAVKSNLGKGLKLAVGASILGRVGLGVGTYMGLESLQDKLNELDVPDGWRVAGNTAFDVAQGGLTGLATGGPVAGLAGLIAGGAGAAAKPYGGGGGRTGFGASFGAKGGGAVQSPVPGVAPTTGYGAKDSSGIWSGTNNTHKGQDYPMPIGSDVQAAMDGIVFDDAPGFQYGITIQIDHENGYQTLYGHLSKSLVKPGERVKKGQVIGKSGDTGNVTGPHLHFEVRKGSNNPVDPGQLVSAPFSGAGALMTYSTSTTSSTSGASTASNQSPQSSGGQLSGKMGTKDQQKWAKDFLSRIGAPTSASNVSALNTWMRAEGKGWSTSLNRATYNPLNTTLERPGSVSFNKVGVQAYTSPEQGMEATIATLTGKSADKRGYTAIIDALKADAGTSAVLGAINNSSWRTGQAGGAGAYSTFGSKGGGTSGFGASIPTQSGAQTINNNVSITVQVQHASDEEALRFAKKVKKYIDQDSALKVMGSK